MNNNDLLRELCNAAKNGNVESIKRLLAQDNAGNAINLQDNNGQTPLHFVTKHRFIKITASLNFKEYWSSYDNRDKEFVDVAKLLLNAGANPNIQDNGGQTPLHLAIKWHYLPASLVIPAKDEVDIPCRSTDLIKILCKNNNIDFSLKNGDGCTAVDLALFLKSDKHDDGIAEHLQEKRLLRRKEQIKVANNSLVIIAENKEQILKLKPDSEKTDADKFLEKWRELPIKITEQILDALDDDDLGAFQQLNEERKVALGEDTIHEMI
ncbi:ankyrin repeat domain-containing protein [Orientia tsutsugamushi]|uniref:Ankyrin repeat family protein n=1 Tax=Orientia tsutsugamushi str. TA716 TaxID=1359175 RepID=A0A0F3NVH2_ORITS|nr:ankyrin repeat domain-containing protein [Orientia tsutsugamushi]KJV72060.1 ankyrin repeat family protein [Orientia tsutsugamushi str. TA716]